MSVSCSVCGRYGVVIWDDGLPRPILILSGESSSDECPSCMGIGFEAGSQDWQELWDNSHPSREKSC